MGIAALLLIVPFLFSPLALLVIAPVTVTRNRTFGYKVTGLTTFVANLLGAGLIVFPPPLLEDLAKAFDDKRIPSPTAAVMKTSPERSFFCQIPKSACLTKTAWPKGPCGPTFPAPRAASATRPPKLSAIRNTQVPA